jgi:hypothetical protein
MPRRDRIAGGKGGGKRKLLPQVLNPVHEIFNGCPCIAVMCGEERFYWVEFRLFVATVASALIGRTSSFRRCTAVLIIKLSVNSGRGAARVCS